MAAKTASCFSSMKKTLGNPKTYTGVLVFSVYGFLQFVVKRVYINPRTAAMSRHLTDMEHTDPSSADYAGLLRDVRQEAGELLLIAIAVALVALTLAFAKQIVVACFAAASTKDRRTPDELRREVVKYLKGPLIATAAFAVLQSTLAALLNAYLDTLMRRSEVPSVQVFLVVGVAYLVFLLFGHAAQVRIAASVVDGGARGILQAWRVIFRVRRTLDSVLVLVTLLLPTVLIPLYAVALLHTKMTMGFGLSLLSAYSLLTGVLDLSYLAAAIAYCYQTILSEEVVVASDGYAAIPSGGANVDGAAPSEC